MVKRMGGVLLVLTAALLPLYADGPAVERDARVTSVLGQVSLRAAERPDESVTLENNTPLSAGDAIETGPQSRVEITMDGETFFQVQPESQVKIENLSRQNTRLVLLQG